MPEVPPPSYAYPYPSPYPQPYPPAPRRSGWKTLLAIVLGVIALFVLMGLFSWFIARATSNSGGVDSAFDGSHIAVIDITGVLTSTDPVSKQLQRMADRSDVKAIVLHIDSPGGGAAVSQELYHEVLRVRQEKHKKIYASIESTGASGAYYIASACDRIYANDASVVGSIGVIMEWTQYGDLLKWAKLKPVVLYDGDLKDAGDPSRDMTPTETAYFKTLIDNMYGQFIHDVAAGRHTTDDHIRPLATGQVWTGQQARSIGLVDRQGGLQVAVTDAAHDAGISGEPSVVRPPKQKGLFGGLLGTEADTLLPTRAKLLDQAPGFYFMWK